MLISVGSIISRGYSEVRCGSRGSVPVDVVLLVVLKEDTGMGRTPSLAHSRGSVRDGRVLPTRSGGPSLCVKYGSKGICHSSDYAVC